MSAPDVLENMRMFLITAPANWVPETRIKCFSVPPPGETISCVLWGDLFYITGTDIVRALMYRFECFGRKVTMLKKFEEGVFSDLRALKSGVDAILEEPRSEFLKFLHDNGAVRTQKKQKVFFWFSVDHDKLFLDALERDLRREREGQEPCTVAIEPMDSEFTSELARRHVATMPFTHSNASKAAAVLANMMPDDASAASIAGARHASGKNPKANVGVEYTSDATYADTASPMTMPMHLPTSMSVGMDMYAPATLSMAMPHYHHDAVVYDTTLDMQQLPITTTGFTNMPLQTMSSSTTTSNSSVSDALYATSNHVHGFAYNNISDPFPSNMSSVPSPKFSDADSMVSEISLMHQSSQAAAVFDGNPAHFAHMLTSSVGNTNPFSNQQQQQNNTNAMMATAAFMKLNNAFAHGLSVVPGIAPQQQRQHATHDTGHHRQVAPGVSSNTEHRPLPCPAPSCGKHFRRKEQLRRHVRTHHRGLAMPVSGDHNTAVQKKQQQQRHPLSQLLHNRQQANQGKGDGDVGRLFMQRSNSHASHSDGSLSETESVMFSGDAPSMYADSITAAAVAAAASATASHMGSSPRLGASSETPPPAPIPSLLPPPASISHHFGGMSTPPLQSLSHHDGSTDTSATGLPITSAKSIAAIMSSLPSTPSSSSSTTVTSISTSGAHTRLKPIAHTTDIVLGHHIPPTPTTLVAPTFMQDHDTAIKSISDSVLGLDHNEMMPHPFESDVSSGMYDQSSQFLVS